MLLSAIVAAGIGYAIFTDPEYPIIRLVNQAIRGFAQNAGGLENQFRARASLPISTNQLSLDFVDADDQINKLAVDMLISSQFVTLVFPDTDSPLANQTIILEPYIKNEQIRWKCIDGSVLIRFRSKDCRLGYGILISELLANEDYERSTGPKF